MFYPLVYWLRKPVRKYKIKPLWYYLDDTDGDFGADYWRGDKPKNLWTAYKWSVLRNPAWNLQESLKPENGLEIVKYHNGKFLKDISLLSIATLKYVDSFGQYSDNKGEYLSLRYSRVGKMFIWYKVGNNLYWRYSFANEVKWLGGIWIEIQIGTTYRYTFRLKFKNPKVYEWDKSIN